MIVITGASSGLGAALAKQYDKSATPLYLTGRSEQKLANLAQHLSHHVRYHPCDMANATEVEALFDTLDKAPEMVIHCAGSGYFGRLEDQQSEQIDQLINNNLCSAINLLR